ncbi:SRPBCC family protein [Gracilibacillus sp. D59]|uniref:SRPBCC family protein n=1 Tax=Gracilibacillus sp. D59 TaxID=3457434 RepID=UPI003FCD309D
MVDIETEITINRPIDDVSAYATNPDNAPEWYENIHSAEWKNSKPLQLGSQIAFKAWFLRGELAYVYQITELIPGSKLVMKTANGPFPMETIYTWHFVDDNRTQMVLRNKGKPSGFSKLFTPFMGMMIRRANRKDLQRIKEILEKK